ncbi:MAG: preprotein translocase subunit SecA [Myxococcota bacterium]
MPGFLRKLFGSANQRTLRRLAPLVEKIGALEAGLEARSGEDLRRVGAALRERAEKGEPLDALLPEAFALVREASRRTVGMRPFDVQLLGGIILHQGKIAEMKTGEGKTLVATLPCYLNALTGEGVHVVTVNDYLARRDAEWMGAIHRFLGLEVGCVVHGLTDAERKAAYAADVTYGQNNEFGFDYLRDNMKPTLDHCVQRPLNFAIVDEVDSILIDEARTPLIISGPVDDDPELFRRLDRVIPKLVAEQHFTIDEKQRNPLLTDEGVARIEEILKIDNLYAPDQVETLHVIQNALRAHVIYKRDVDYVVKDGQVVIVDEFTGRLMEGRRWSDGLHQAVEAKEGVSVQSETQTYASITFQNYFRMYRKLSGMTGTADTEAAEFAKIYDLDVVVVPTNQPMVRDDRPDLVYRTQAEKWEAVVEDIRDCHARGQPVLVGTIAIETSELVSRMLKKCGIPHNVLNAKHHGREAEIIAQAGRKGAVTISTNMAGRGTDIVLGGNPEMMLQARGLDPKAEENREELERLRAQSAEERVAVIQAGGLHVLGTERHDSRRIDNQLRGRSGRQGDAGSSRFYLSLEDDLMRRFGSDRIAPLMGRLGMEEGEPIEHKMVTNAIQRAQSKVEAQNFDVRKRLLEYDDVMNRQREAIYTWRHEVLSKDDLSGDYLEMAEEIADSLVDAAAPDYESLAKQVEAHFGIRLDMDEPCFQTEDPDRDTIAAYLRRCVGEKLEEKRKLFAELERRFPDLSPPSFQLVARDFLMRAIDSQWKDHLCTMDHLRQEVGLQGMGGRDPLREYQREGYNLFAVMHERIRQTAVETFFKVVFEVPSEERIRQLREQRAAEEARRAEFERRLSASHPGSDASQPPEVARPVVRQGRKVGRNEPCPCGSGKKYKRCHGMAA